MSEVDQLHWALRRYCEDGAAEWAAKYDKLRRVEEKERRSRGEQEPKTYSYSPEAYATFPRYQVLEAILIAVEAFTPADFSSLDEARMMLAAAGETAESIFTTKLSNDIERDAIGEERAKFVRYAETVSVGELSQIDSLPFRRTLSATEIQQIRATLRDRWALDEYWYPIDRPGTDDPPANTLVFSAAPFFEASLQQVLRRVIEDLSGRRVFEIREGDYPASRELDLDLFEPVYVGTEGIWTSQGADWLIYASHESSVTVTGPVLLGALKTAWPGWSSNLYSFPD